MAQHASPRRFAPLQQGIAADQMSNLPKLKGVVFDVDGTLCEPQNHMFGEMRSVLGIPKSVDILEHVYSLSPPAAQDEAMESIRAIERREMARQTPQPGLAELMAYLDRRGVPKAICTRNFDAPVNHLLTKFLPGSVFHPVITREFRPPKPDPAGILFIARSWGLVQSAAANPEEDGANQVADASGLIMVGDSIDDMTAGRKAGAATVLLVNKANEHLSEHAHTDMVITKLDELVHLLERGFAGRHITEN
ncbi:Histidinol phosphatase or a related phosphatase [Apiospora marii]|uniref:Histidinol phosphatase or a related phosphatase n=1 Tax=Apiospora marii TaxID=335849 RepID=A0ABR1S6X6_9PEZI